MTQRATTAALCPVCLLALALPGGETMPGDGATGRASYHVLTVLEGDDDRTMYLAERCWPSCIAVTVEVVRAGAVPRATLEARLRALKRITHPGTARILDTLLAPSGDCCVVAEYVPGLPLRDYCARYALPVVERLRLLSGVCRAIERAHEVGVVHGRLSANVVIVAGGGEHAAPSVIGFSVCGEDASEEGDLEALVEMARAIDLASGLPADGDGAAARFGSVRALANAIDAQRARDGAPSRSPTTR